MSQVTKGDGSKGQFNHATTSLKAELLSVHSRLGQLVTSCEASTRNARTAVSEAEVRHFIAWRANRGKALGTNLFADPAWDILLELYAANLGRQSVSVTSLCIAANVPATTALRWIKLLESEGHLVRKDDPFDRRRSFVVISKAAEANLDAFFNEQALPALAFASAN